jgi:hypothetical protein
VARFRDELPRYGGLGSAIIFMIQMLILASAGLSAFAAQLGTNAGPDRVSHLLDTKRPEARLEGGGADATTRIQAAIDALRDGQSLQIAFSLVRSAVANRAAITVVGKKNVTISGAITNDQFGIDSSYWKTIASLVATGNVVMATTATAHGLRPGSVGVYCEKALDYSGPVTIMSVPSATTFIYSTYALGTNALTNVTTGVMKWAPLDFNRSIFEFRDCQNVSVNLDFHAAAIPDAIRHRLGYSVLKFMRTNGVDNANFDIVLTGDGASYGIWAGTYQSAEFGHLVKSKIRMDVRHFGYPIAGWAALNGSEVEIHGEDVHRVLYADGVDGLRGKLFGKNYDSSGVIITSHFYGGTNHIGSQNVDLEFTDTGTDRDPSFATQAVNGRFGVGIQGYPEAGIPVFENIRLGLSLKQTDVIGRNIIGALIHILGTNVILRNIEFHGSIDRSQLKNTNGLGANYEVMVTTPADATAARISFTDWHVTNSPVTSRAPAFMRKSAVPNR